MFNVKTNVVAVFGYNNTRLYDVENIQKLCFEKFKAQLILIKEGITEADYKVTPYCLDAKPENINLAPALESFCDKNNLELIGCLPFSDKGVVGAAHAARDLGLFHDDVATSFAMLDKNEFRNLERDFNGSANYKKPFFKKCFDANSLFEVLNTHGAFFIKPSSEGNSRGCMKIETKNDLLMWLEHYHRFLEQGVMCEEYLSSGCEYSFDGVNSTYWITEKYTTNGAYRAEYQHIVPAPLSVEDEFRIKQTLSPLLSHLGSKGGAFHHEFFNNSRISSVEPNRRPAGMWIWDLAEWSFCDFKTWSQWIDVCCGISTERDILVRDFYSGVRGVIAPRKSKIKSIDTVRIKSDLKYQFGTSRLMIFKKPGDLVTHEPRDNSDFIAFVATRNKDYQTLKSNLELAENIVLRNIVFEDPS